MPFSVQLQKLPRDLSIVVEALVEFLKSSRPGIELEYHSRSSRYVTVPKNYASFQVIPKRGIVAMTLYGLRYEFAEEPELPLQKGPMYSYSRCDLSDPSQLAAAVSYLKQAIAHKEGGRSRFRQTKSVCGGGVAV